MKFRRFFSIALRNLLRHRERSIVAIIAIASGFASLALFEGYIASVERSFDVTYSQRLMYGDLIVEKENVGETAGFDDAKTQMDVELQDKLENLFSSLPEITNRVRFLNFLGLASNGLATTSFVGTGYDLEAGRKMRAPIWQWNTLAGTPLDMQGEAILGKRLGSILGCIQDSELRALEPTGGYIPKDRPFHCKDPQIQLSTSTQTGQTNAADVTVTGLMDAIYRELDLRSVFLPLERAQSLTGTKNVSFYTLRVRENASVEMTAALLNEKTREQNLHVLATPWRKHRFGEIYVQSVNFLRVFQIFTVLVILIIVTLSVLSTMTRLVQERSREIGTLRSLGFKSRSVLFLFLVETAQLAISGCIIGAVSALLISGTFNSAGIIYKVGILSEGVPFQILSPLRIYLWAGFALIVLACAASYWALRRTLKAAIPDNFARRG